MIVEFDPKKDASSTLKHGVSLACFAEIDITRALVTARASQRDPRDRGRPDRVFDRPQGLLAVERAVYRVLGASKRTSMWLAASWRFRLRALEFGNRGEKNTGKALECV